MADLLAEPLADILQRESGKSDAAWKEHFRKNYLDRSVIFDAPVYAAGAGVFRIDYPISVAGRPARVEIHDPPAFRALKVEWPARLLVGVRLAEPRKDPRGHWLILGRPDSVVIFTEPAMFQGSSVPADADLADVLKRQAALLDGP